jgi:hypothetical protein
MLIQLQIDVVVESTGSPYAAAVHADAGSLAKVVMVSKEVGVVLGPPSPCKAEGWLTINLACSRAVVRGRGSIFSRGQDERKGFVYDQTGAGHEPEPVTDVLSIRSGIAETGISEASSMRGQRH